MSPDFPFPETLWSLGCQLQLLRTGRKRLLLLPHGVMPEGMLTGLHTQATHRGTFAAVDPVEFIELPSAIAEDRIGDLLGYGIARKPEQPDRAVSLVDEHGREILTVMADAATEPAVRTALRAMADQTQRVIPTEPTEVLRERARWWLHFFENLQPETSSP